MHSEDEIERARKIINARIVHNAILHMDGLEARDAAVLQIAGSIDFAPITDFDEHLVGILLGRTTDSVLETVSGPYLFYSDQKEKHQRFGFEIANGLFDQSDQIRNSCLARLLTLITDEDVFGESTKAILYEQKVLLASTDDSVWRRAAISSWDALYSDPGYHALAVRQASGTRYNDGFERHLPRIFVVGRKFVESNISGAILPFSDKESKAVRNSLRSCSNLAELCEEYSQSYGFLPLRYPVSLGEAINEWSALRDVHDIEEELFTLIQDKPHPDILFLLCSDYLRRKSKIDDEKSKRVLELVLQFAAVATDDLSLTASSYWALRAELAKHYFFSLRTAIPALDDANLAIFSWKLATQISSALITTGHALDHFREHLLKPSVGAAGLICDLAGIEQIWSPLGIIFRTFGDPWQTALVNLLGELDGFYKNLASSEIFWERFSPQITGAAWQNVVEKLCSKIEPSVQLESQGVLKFYQNPRNYDMPLEMRDSIRLFLENCEKFSLDDSVRDLLLSAVSPQFENSRSIALSILKLKLGISMVKFDIVWSCIKDHDWLSSCIRDFSNEDLQTLLDLVVVGMAGEKGEWRFEIPHRFARFFNRNIDISKREALFSFVFFSSFQLGASSALEDLMSRRHELDLDDIRLKHMQFINNIQARSPDWIRSRLRMFRATLSNI